MENTNEYSSRGYVQDLLQSIANDCCVVNHLYEKLYSIRKDIDETEDDEALRKEEEDITSAIKHVTDTRRRKMALMESWFPNFDKKLHCPMKHIIEGTFEMMEVAAAIITDPEAKPKDVNTVDVLLQESYSNMAMVISKALGFELEPCWRCLSDMM